MSCIVISSFLCYFGKNIKDAPLSRIRLASSLLTGTNHCPSCSFTSSSCNYGSTWFSSMNRVLVLSTSNVDTRFLSRYALSQKVERMKEIRTVMKKSCEYVVWNLQFMSPGVRPLQMKRYIVSPRLFRIIYVEYVASIETSRLQTVINVPIKESTKTIAERDSPQQMKMNTGA